MDYVRKSLDLILTLVAWRNSYNLSEITPSRNMSKTKKEDAFVKELLALAKQYNDAAVILNDSNKCLFGPMYFCAQHSLELCLKAYLASQKYSEKELRKIGHDLQALFAAACAEGLGDIAGLNSVDKQSVEYVSEVYRSKSLEYPFQDNVIPFTIPIGHWLQLNDSILKSLNG